MQNLSNYPASVDANMIEAFYSDATGACASCTGSGCICDDCGEPSCDCKPYDLDGETFVPESSPCRNCTPPKVRR